MKNDWNSALYDDAHRFVFDLGAGVVELLAPQKGEKILDLGCGTGQLCAQIAEAGADVVGFDASLSMLAKARDTFPQMRWHQADARDFDFGNDFDAVFSNAVLHWIEEPEKVVARVFAALKPGGRFVGEFGGQGNVAVLHRSLRLAARDLDLPHFDERKFFPPLGKWATLLEEGGLETRFAWLFERPTPLQGEDGIKNWWRQFCASYLDELDASTRETLLNAAQQRAKPVLWRDGNWFADYRRLRFVAVRS